MIFKTLVDIVKNLLEPQSFIYAEGEIFRERNQKVGEPVAEFLQQLKHFSSPCNFGQALEENLCEQFVTPK